MNRRQTIPKELRYTRNQFDKDFPNDDVCLGLGPLQNFRVINTGKNHAADGDMGFIFFSFLDCALRGIKVCERCEPLRFLVG